MTLSEKQAKQQIKDLKAKLKIANQALNKIASAKGLDGDTYPPHKIAQRARHNIKYYKEWTTSHDVEED